MDNTQTGGPVFPRTTKVWTDPITGNIEHEGNDGMKLLDHFAGQAMQGITCMWKELAWEAPSRFPHLARWSYEIAAAMIAERNRIMNEKP